MNTEDKHTTETDHHDARCEREYTANGFIFIDCLCAQRRAQEQAWDECVEEAHALGWLHDFGSANMHERNPYRLTSPPRQGSGV